MSNCQGITKWILRVAQTLRRSRKGLWGLSTDQRRIRERQEETWLQGR